MTKSVEEIIVSLHNHDAARLHKDPTNGRISLQYLESYLKCVDTRMPISMSLPLQKEPIVETYGGLHAYFLNLMPEGWTKQIAKEYNLGFSDDLYALLKLQAPLGAIQFHLQPGMSQKVDFNSSLIEISSNEHTIPLVKLLHCLYCGKNLIKPGYNNNLHDHCSHAFFGTLKAPLVDAEWATITEGVKHQLELGIVLTGVQPKFSAKFRSQRDTIRAEIDSYHYIVKPEPRDPYYKDMTRLEASVTQFAQTLGIRTCDALQYFLKDGTPAYMTKRFDLARTEEGTIKLHMEDSAQALGISPESKYSKGSHEKIGKLIRENETIPNESARRQLVEYLQVTIFNFVMANAGAHLKNHSFFHITRSQVEILGPKHPLLWSTRPEAKAHQNIYSENYITITTPYYDLFPARLYPSSDQDDLGLKMSGKTKNLTQQHFIGLAEYLGIRKPHAAAIVKALTRKIHAGRTNLIEICHKNGVSETHTKHLLDYVADKLKILDS